MNPKLLKFKAINDNLNVSITDVLEYQQMLADFGMQFDKIVAIQGTNPQGPEDEIDLNVMHMLGVPVTEAFYFCGRYKSDADQKAYEIGLERAEIAGKDGFNTLIYLRGERKPGAPLSEDLAAAAEIPAIHDIIKQGLDAIRAKVHIPVPLTAGNIEGQ